MLGESKEQKQNTLFANQTLCTPSYWHWESTYQRCWWLAQWQMIPLWERWRFSWRSSLWRTIWGEKEMLLIDARVAFIVFMERSVKKCRKHLCVIWLSSNPNVQLGLWCIRVLVKPYYSNINQVHKSQSRVKEKCVHPSVSIQISVSSNHITRYNESATAVVVEYWISQHR